MRLRVRSRAVRERLLLARGGPRLWAIVFSCFFLLAAACGSEPEPEETAANDDAPAEEEEDDDEGRGDFASLGAGGGERTVRVAYRFQIPDPEIDDILEGDAVFAQQPPRRAIRLDFDGDVVQLIAPGDDTGIVCTGGPGDPCVQGTIEELEALDPQGVIMGPVFSGPGEMAEDPRLSEFEPLEERTIAGRSAVCAAWEPGFVGGSRIEHCLDAETGVALSWSMRTREGQASFEAADVGSPTDADLQPTGPVQEPEDDEGE